MSIQIRATLDLSRIQPGDILWAGKPHKKTGVWHRLTGEVVEILDRSHYVLDCNGAEIQVLAREIFAHIESEENS